MNWVFIIVLIILALNIWQGYRKGFVRIIFSLAALLITLVLAAAVTPHITSYIEQHTSMDETITEKCLSHIEQKAQGQIDEKAEEEKQKLTDQTQDSGIMLPDSWMDKLADAGGDIVDEQLRENGIYQNMAEKLAHFIISIISFAIAFAVISILLHLLIGALDLVTKLPLIKGVNRFFGILAGLIKGLLIIWLLLFLVKLFADSTGGLLLTDYISRNAFLTFLYENNFVMKLLARII